MSFSEIPWIMETDSWGISPFRGQKRRSDHEGGRILEECGIQQEEEMFCFV